jgi:hypothetical protein
VAPLGTCLHSNAVRREAATVTRCLLSVRSTLGAVFLLAQLGLVVYEQMGSSRYFCWAPNDYVVDYRLDVTVAGRPLSADEVMRRYRFPQAGRMEQTVQHLIDIVQQYEMTYGRAEQAEVLLSYRPNGHAEQDWRWPPA